MTDFLEILKYVLPSLVVLATSYLLLKIFIDNMEKTNAAERSEKNRQKILEISLKNKELINPIRLQAYERIVLFLERISPNSLIMRIHRPDLTAHQLQLELISNIRDEFEHNLSQQVYMSSQAWEMIREAKEEVIKLINSSMLNFDNQSTAIDLSQKIFENISKTNKLPTTDAIEFVKKEIREIF